MRHLKCVAKCRCGEEVKFEITPEDFLDRKKQPIILYCIFCEQSFQTREDKPIGCMVYTGTNKPVFFDGPPEERLGDDKDN